MTGILDILKDKERRCILISISIVFIIGYFGISLAIDNVVSQIEKNYINQNVSIVGQIVEDNPELEDIVVSIITGNSSDGYEVGKNIMDKYSYNDKMSSEVNPLTKDITLLKVKNITIFWIVFFVCVFTCFNHFTTKILENIKLLTKRAENIVDGKFGGVSPIKFQEGIFSRFNSQFDLMEDRMKNMVEKLKDERITLKNIINDISHQLKTPLAALIMYNDIMLEYSSGEDNDMNEFTLLSKEQLGRMNWLISTLLKYARLESNSIAFDKELSSLSDTIYDSISSIRKKAELKSQTINFKLEDEVILVHDRNWMSEAIINIIKNSVEHTSEGGIIDIVLEETPMSVEIIIKDNGKGIPKNKLKKVFERFYKDENNMNPQSIGIGLALTKSIIEAHDGNIYVDSELGEWTSFHISFLKL